MSVIEEKKKTTRRRGLHRIALFMPEEQDPWINFSIWFLAAFGLLMIASASMGLAVSNPNYLVFTVAKQIVFLVGGFILMHMVANWFKVSWLTSPNFPFAAIVMAGALLICLAFPAVNGAKAWIRVPISGMDVSIQPSEFAKTMAVLIVAAYLGDVKKRFDSSFRMIARPAAFIFMYLFIVWILQDDFGSMVVIAVIAFVCFMIPSHPQLRKWQLAFRALFIFGMAMVLLLLSPYGEDLVQHLPLQQYQINRILSSINPFADQYGTGYQLINGLISFATGGWRGLGFGNSVRKYTNFPAANTDFILSIIVEELGFIGFMLVFIPYMIIVVRLIRYALKMKSEKGAIILVGISMYIVIHCLFNIGGVTGLIPLTGVPLLMISAGGSSTLSLMMAIGIAQAVIAQYKRGEIQ